MNATTSSVKSGLYHKELGFPVGVLEPWLNKTVQLKYSRHAQQAILSDRYGVPRVPLELLIRAAQVIEIEVQDESVVKIVTRIPYDNTRDLVLVIMPFKAAPALVKTVWFNMTDDQHHTLRAEVYQRP
jgi:hypothetical protein